MTRLISSLDNGAPQSSGVIGWSCPVPFFGDLASARVATVGINPSGREFLNQAGRELGEDDRRFPTLASLDLTSWAEATSVQMSEIVDSCITYFRRNPFERWFGTLETLLEPIGASFYGNQPSACHLDIVPYATYDKWGNLRPSARDALMELGKDCFDAMIRRSEVDLLILNGKSVVQHFEAVAGVELSVTYMKNWNLPRETSAPVVGVAYAGCLSELGDVALPRPVSILGYNHNLQSSFGVSRNVLTSIGHWIADSSDL